MGKHGAAGTGGGPTKKSKRGNVGSESLEKTPADPTPILIACFNYKGGVGKTSCAANLGAALRSLGYRTCYVDCDSQCNLSTFFNRQEKPAATDEEGESGSEFDENNFLSANESDEDGADGGREHQATSVAGPARPNVRAARKPSLAKFPVARVVQQYPVELCRQGNFDRAGRPFPVTLKRVLMDSFLGRAVPTGVLEFASKVDSEGRKEYPSLPEGLFLLPGDKDLNSILEVRLNQAIVNIQGPGHEDAFMALGGFRKALYEIGKELRIKYFVCDFGPSAGIINEILVGSCDMIVPPFQPDFFSASSVYGLLHNMLPTLISKQRIINTQQDKYLPKCDLYNPYRFNTRAPRLLPFLMTNFQVSNNEVAMYDSNFFDLVTRIVAAEDVPEEVKCVYEPDRDGSMVVPFLRHVPVILKEAQTRGEPVVGMTPAILREQFGDRRLPHGILTELRHATIAFLDLARMVQCV
eukprot:jgi/Mesvir1/1715/Mv25963-RA.1